MAETAAGVKERVFTKAPQRRGFTLVELVVTTFIISLLLAILVPKFSTARRQAKRAVCLSHQRSICFGLITYANENNDKLPQTASNYGEASPREMIYKAYGKTLVNLGWLLERDLLERKVLLCPSATKANFSREFSKIDEKGGTPVVGDYVYALSIPQEQSPSISSLGSIAIISDNFVASETEDHVYAGLGLGHYSHRTGYNVAYLDGSAAFYGDPKEVLANERIDYDDETDEFDFRSLDANGQAPKDSPETMRIYEAWFALSAGDPDRIATIP